eukprot:3670250-Pyramimonas_sp.AAC.2
MVSQVVVSRARGSSRAHNDVAHARSPSLRRRDGSICIVTAAPTQFRNHKRSRAVLRAPRAAWSRTQAGL